MLLEAKYLKDSKIKVETTVIEKDKGMFAEFASKTDNELIELLKAENKKIEMKNSIFLKQKESQKTEIKLQEEKLKSLGEVIVSLEQKIDLQLDGLANANKDRSSELQNLSDELQRY